MAQCCRENHAFTASVLPVLDRHALIDVRVRVRVRAFWARCRLREVSYVV